MSKLAPPGPQDHEKEDAGAHELESSDDHFSDASEGQGHRSRSHTTSSTSPIPVMRVERVDETPAYGEVPGTAAYKMRAQDAVPDEIEIIPDGQRSRSASRVSESDRPLTPGGTAIPKTIVEKVEPENPSYGEVPGTEAYEKRRADAEPDEILMSPTKTRMNLEGEQTTHRSELPGQTIAAEGDDEPPDLAEGEEDEGFGDDFDDFEEGEQGDCDDFGDFGDIVEESSDAATDLPVLPSAPLPADTLEGIPPLDLRSLKTPQDFDKALAPYLSRMLSSDYSNAQNSETEPSQPDPLLSDRSASLWAQLVAPPPLQPPNWTRSRIRRLFLVSLGVPVDLDEILPASKQKKLVLPSIHLGDEQARPSAQLQRISQANASSTSVGTTDSKTNEHKKERKKKGPPERAGPAPPPKFDANAARLLCSTTEAALGNFTDEELKSHVSSLQERITDVNAVLEYWLKRKESAMGDKEAFEGVIENLVGFVAKSKGSKAKR